jgi:hypothetical protein
MLDWDGPLRTQVEASPRNTPAIMLIIDLPGGGSRCLILPRSSLPQDGLSVGRIFRIREWPHELRVHSIGKETSASCSDGWVTFMAEAISTFDTRLPV